MSRLALCGILGILLSSSPALAEDSWTGRDKLAHGAVSGWLAINSYALARPRLESRWQCAALGFGVSTSLGALKELADLGRHGTASGRDFTWDVAGAATGALSAWAFDWLFESLFAATPENQVTTDR